jgi:hypothetical protein
MLPQPFGSGLHKRISSWNFRSMYPTQLMGRGIYKDRYHKRENFETKNQKTTFLMLPIPT